MKYNVGDRVKIVNKRTYSMNTFGLMDHWLGKTMTIRAIYKRDYKMKEDKSEFDGNSTPGWDWNEELVVGLVGKNTRKQYR